MTRLLLLPLLLLQIVEFDPAHVQLAPPVETNLNIVSSTWVIADIGVTVEGRVQFPKILKGADPLAKDVLWNVSRWVFKPARSVSEVSSHVAGVFLFRGREMYSSPPPNLTDIRLSGPDRPPVPIYLTDPGYLPNSIAEGEVLLEVRLTESGSIANMYAITLIPGLTEFTQAAVSSWKFAPAYVGGQPVPGTVVVCVSYLRPVLAQLR
jgi:hypothetical protein